MERLQKILSQAGVASRRASEQLMLDGRVTVNGVTVRQLGSKADAAHDDIRVDGRRVKVAERHRYLLLNKPRGYVTTRSRITVAAPAVTIDGTDVTHAIRTPEIDRAAAAVARLPRVRAVLVERQRQMGQDGGIVMEGRDIGTVVFPSADANKYCRTAARSRSICDAGTSRSALPSSITATP